MWYHTWQRQERKNNGEEMSCSSRVIYRYLSWKKLHLHNGKLPFNLVHVRILGSMEYGKTRNDFSMIINKNRYIVKEILCRKIQWNNWYKIKIQHWIGYTVWLIEIAHFSVHILLLHHYKSDLAHLSDL